MTLDDLRNTVASIRYRDWIFDIGETSEGFWLAVRLAVDGQEWRARSWFIERQSTKSEFVQTCLKAVLAAEEHEARERFTYKGAAIFGPHHDIEGLVELANARRQ